MTPSGLDRRDAPRRAGGGVGAARVVAADHVAAPHDVRRRVADRSRGSGCRSRRPAAANRSRRARRGTADRTSRATRPAQCAAANRRRSARPRRSRSPRRAGTACRSTATPAVSSGPIAASRLQEDRAGVDAGVDPEDTHARARLALDDLPGNGAAAAKAGQQRRVKADAAQLRGLEHGGGTIWVT